MTIRDVVLEELAAQLGCPVDEIEDTSSIRDDLGADSLDELELLMTYEERFGIEIPEEAVEALVTVGEGVAWLEAHGATVMPTPVHGWRGTDGK